MLSNIHLPTIRIGKRSINVFPYWVSLLIVGILFGLVGAFTVLRDGLQVTGLSNAIPWGSVDFRRPLCHCHGRMRLCLWRDRLHPAHQTL